jgi:hypothetical protein
MAADVVSAGTYDGIHDLLILYTPAVNLTTSNEGWQPSRSSLDRSIPPICINGSRHAGSQRPSRSCDASRQRKGRRHHRAAGPSALAG